MDLTLTDTPQSIRRLSADFVGAEISSTCPCTPNLANLGR
jgi:hypothetical protein